MGAEKLISSILVPKLCLGTHLPAKLSLAFIVVPKCNLGTGVEKNLPNKCHSERSEESHISKQVEILHFVQDDGKVQSKGACKPYHLSLAGDKAVIRLAARKIKGIFLKKFNQ